MVKRKKSLEKNILKSEKKKDFEFDTVTILGIIIFGIWILMASGKKISYENIFVLFWMLIFVIVWIVSYKKFKKA